MPGRAAVKKLVRRWLASGGDAPPEAAGLHGLSARALSRALLASLSDTDPLVKWRAVRALGRLVAAWAAEDPEAAREVMRRLVWGLNDESGAVGFGFAEALGEIMARDQGLAREFLNLLISYLDPQGAYLEFPPLQQGAVWGLSRVVGAWPELAAERRAAGALIPLLSSPDPTVRGLAAWGLGCMGAASARHALEGLLGDQERLEVFRRGELGEASAGELAAEALAGIA